MRGEEKGGLFCTEMNATGLGVGRVMVELSCAVQPHSRGEASHQRCARGFRDEKVAIRVEQKYTFFCRSGGAAKNLLDLYHTWFLKKR